MFLKNKPGEAKAQTIVQGNKSEIKSQLEEIGFIYRKSKIISDLTIEI